MRLWPLLLACSMVVACEDDKPPPQPVSGPATTATAAATEARVRILIDGEEVAVATDFAAPRSLLSYLPENERDGASWHTVLVTSDDGRRRLSLPDFREKYRPEDLKLYRDEKLGPAVGVFRPIADDMPEAVKQKLSKPTSSLAGVATVDVRTGPPPEPEPLSSLTVNVADASVILAADALAAMPEITATDGEQQAEDREHGKHREKRGGGRNRDGGKGRDEPGKGGGPSKHRRGVHLAEVIAHVGKQRDVAAITEVTVAAPEEQTPIAIGWPPAEGVTPLLRRSRRGRLDFFLWQRGEPKPRRIRGVTTITLGPAK